MQLVTAQTILDGAQIAMSRDLTQLELRQQQQGREALSLAVQEVWAAWWWESLMSVQQTQFAPTYSNEILVIPGQVAYWPLTDDYYQCYILDSGEPTDSAGTLSAGWLKASDHLKVVPEFDVHATYTAGNLVSWRGLRYVNALGAQTVFTPDLDTLNWTAVPDVTFGFPYTDWDGTETGPVGAVRAVSVYDPRRTTNSQPLEIIVTPGSCQVLCPPVGRPFVWTRSPVPLITGDAFDATASYTATDREELATT
jgi:hypothetical protein